MAEVSEGSQHQEYMDWCKRHHLRNRIPAPRDKKKQSTIVQPRTPRLAMYTNKITTKGRHSVGSTLASESEGCGFKSHSRDELKCLCHDAVRPAISASTQLQPGNPGLYESVSCQKTQNRGTRKIKMKIQVVALTVLIAFIAVLTASEAVPVEETSVVTQGFRTAQEYVADLATQGKALMDRIQIPDLMQKTGELIGNVPEYLQQVRQRVTAAWTEITSP
ncbi:uncharacterized protein [Heptranchias perlo]|uniref:uncharacterized protein n=1 Tax=Heptranchias perlo TaxID=212740 RepID=UPI0035595A9A